jgi:DNA mismatch endonuclease, patch repair protein
MVPIAREGNEPRASGTDTTPSTDITPVKTLIDVQPATSARMSKQARRDTEPELLLRRGLHQFGLRYRVDHPLPGMPRRRADILFTRAKVAVFVDGCFWHGCPEHKTTPAHNAAWWTAKLTRNFERDRETDAHLISLGWTVLRVWEHENMTHAATDIGRIVRSRTNSISSTRSTAAGPR